MVTFVVAVGSIGKKIEQLIHRSMGTSLQLGGKQRAREREREREERREGARDSGEERKREREQGDRGHQLETTSID